MEERGREYDGMSDESSSRRSFLQSILIGGTMTVYSTLLGPSPAEAANDDKQVMAAKNRRVGGLANKIRNIGRVMVGGCECFYIRLFV